MLSSKVPIEISDYLQIVKPHKQSVIIILKMYVVFWGNG